MNMVVNPYLVEPGGGGGGSGIQYVGGKVATTQSAGTWTVSLSGLSGGLASSPAAGDFVLVCYGEATNFIQNADLDVSGFTEVTDLFQSDNNFDAINFGIFYKFMSGTPDTDLAASIPIGGAPNGAMVIQVWRGVEPTGPFDTGATSQGFNTGQPAPPGNTPTTTGAVVCSFGSAANNYGISAPLTSSDLTAFLSANVDSGGATNFSVATGGGYFVWTSGTFNPAQFGGNTTSSDSAWAAATVTLKPA